LGSKVTCSGDRRRRPTGTNGRAAVDLVIRAPDGQAIGDAYEFDDSFPVESELILFAEGGVVRYEVVPVPPYEKSYGRADLSGHLDAPDKAVFLACLDGSVAGRVVLSEGWNRYAWIEDIAVDAHRRRAGVGRALMDRAVAWAVGRGLSGLRAETQSNNVPACRFYESCGFRLGGFDHDLYRGLDGRTTEVALFWYRLFRGAPPPRQTSGG
jgi:streptothricin acetyltransferase